MNYVMGQFTVESEIKNYTYYHELGRMPKFCLVYPIDIPENDFVYTVAVEVILNGLGQDDYMSGANATTYTVPNNPFVGWFGTGYTTSVFASSAANSNTKILNSIDEEKVVVGGYYETNATGKLVPGTYGIIIG